MIDDFQSLVGINRRNIHRYHNIKVCIGNISKQAVLETCRHILDKHGAGIFIAPHEVILFELQIVRTAVRSVSFSPEILCGKLRYFDIDTTKNIFQKGYSFICGQCRDRRADLLKGIRYLNINRSEFGFCCFCISRLNGNSQELAADDTVLSLFHLLDKHLIIYINVSVKAVALMLQKHHIIKFGFIDTVVIHRDLNICACIKAV